MKTIPVSLIFFAILSGNVPAEPTPRVKPEAKAEAKKTKRDGGTGMRDAWKTADSNGDGMVSQEEFATMPRIAALPEERRRALFQRLDRNDDGSLVKTEIMKDAKMGHGFDGKEKGRNSLWMLDTDKSGTISYTEFSGGKMIAKLPEERRKAMFDRLDTDKNGEISAEDKPAHPPKWVKPEKGKKPSTQKSIWSLDTNQDGAISFDEFRKDPRHDQLGEDAQEDKFEELDKNDDLVITRADFAEAKPAE